jgi:hypothetical protein
MPLIRRKRLQVVSVPQNERRRKIKELGDAFAFQKHLQLRIWFLAVNRWLILTDRSSPQNQVVMSSITNDDARLSIKEVPARQDRSAPNVC